MLLRSWFAVRPPRCRSTPGSRAAGTSISDGWDLPRGIEPPGSPLRRSSRARAGAWNFVTISFQTKRTGKGVIIAGTGRAGGPGSRESTNTGKAEESEDGEATVNPTRFRIGLVEIESRILTVRPLCSAVGVR